MERLNKEIRNYTNDYRDLDLSFIDTKDKKYKIVDDKNNRNYTLYEYCILLAKYRYIKDYCHQNLKSTYTIDKYFEYCKVGNIEAVYFCILVGVDPEKRNKNDYGNSALIYACYNSYIEMV